MNNPYAIYVNCDGAMDYDPKNSGGIGFVINFPEFVTLQPIHVSMGQYQRANIEMLELEALIEAFRKMIETYEKHGDLLTRVNRIFFITDRFGLHDTEKTNAYQIRQWRSNNWKNHEGKPIKNSGQLDDLDKQRQKLAKLAKVAVSIEHRSRKKNTGPDKLAKRGKVGLPRLKLAKKVKKLAEENSMGPKSGIRF